MAAPLSFQLFLLSLLIAYAILLFVSRRNSRVIQISALVILAAGTVLNMYGLGMENFSEGVVTRFFRAMILTLKMFVYTGDVFEMVHGQETPYFLDLFFFIFFSAMLTSTSAILMLFGKRIMTLCALFLRKKKFRHVFIGVNHRSVMIANGIKNESVAFIDFPSDDERQETSMGTVISGMANEQNQDEFTHRRNAAVLYAKRKLKPENVKKNVFASIGLEHLKKLVNSETAFYILSENGERNLDELMALLSDKDYIHNTIHVCLSREGVSRYYKTTLKGTGTHFIYPSSMAVVELMKAPACHPAYVLQPALTADGRPTGGVKGELNALVIGFGETGQAVTKFLYEFSAAVHEDGAPIPVHIIVNDYRIDSIKGPFIFDSPDMGNSDMIEYENYGTDSSAFWDKLIERLDSLNYIAVSMGEDAANLDLACTIFMYAMKKRRNGLEGLRIVVRKKASLPHETALVEKMNEKANHEVIVCYGEYSGIFTPEMVVSKSRSGINKNATSLAERISEAYTTVSGQKISYQAQYDAYHEKNRARMELHQLISRGNHIASLLCMTAGETQVSPEALENLAKMEHLRYSRYLVAHGYSFAEQDDDIFKTNHQICGWDDLSDSDRQYHRDMVLAQLKAAIEYNSPY